MKGNSHVRKVTLHHTSYWCKSQIAYANGMIGSYSCSNTWIVTREKKRPEEELTPRCPNCGGASYNVTRNKDWTEEYYDCPSLQLMDAQAIIVQGAKLCNMYKNVWSVTFGGGYSSYLNSAAAKKIIDGETRSLRKQDLTSSIVAL